MPENPSTTRSTGPLHQRPRIGGDGRLVLPAAVTVGRSGLVRGRLSDHEVDPFEATADRLLLAESFARLERVVRSVAERWYLQHGAVDRARFNGGFEEVAMDGDRPGEVAGPGELLDYGDGIRAEQGNARWHVSTLARLSDRRREMDWRTEWGQVIVHSQDGDLIVGGPDAGKQRRSEAVIDFLRSKAAEDPAFREALDEQLRLHAETESWPVVTVTAGFWVGFWRQGVDGFGAGVPDETRARAEAFGSSWEQTVELERLLMYPYVLQAMETTFTIEREDRVVDDRERPVLVPRDVRRWTSILAPIYLQFFESLRRITEGDPGAAICRECGQPFLVLDGRRRYFCNDRERYRFTQRQRRQRLKAEADATDEGSR